MSCKVDTATSETGPFKVSDVRSYSACVDYAYYRSICSCTRSRGCSLCLGVLLVCGVVNMAYLERLECPDLLGETALFLGRRKHSCSVQIHAGHPEHGRPFRGVHIGLNVLSVNARFQPNAVVAHASTILSCRDGATYTFSVARTIGIVTATSPGIWQGGERHWYFGILWSQHHWDCRSLSFTPGFKACCQVSISMHDCERTSHLSA